MKSAATVRREKALKEHLGKIFEEVSAGNFHLTPDEAMAMLDELLWTKAQSGDGVNGQTTETATATIAGGDVDIVAVLRSVHLHAVELYYSKYHPRKGRVAHSIQRLDALHWMLKSGKNAAEIAKLVGLKESAIRKQIKQLEKRWQEAVAKVHELGAHQLEQSKKGRKL